MPSLNGPYVKTYDMKRIRYKNRQNLHTHTQEFANHYKHPKNLNLKLLLKYYLSFARKTK